MSNQMDRRQESRVRRLATRHSYHLHHSRAWKHVPNIDNFGEFMLINTRENYVALGPRFDGTLEKIEEFFG